MRLAQLARKLGVKSADIVEFLASQRDVVEDSFNAKLSEVQVEMIIQKFSSHRMDEVETVDAPPTSSTEDQPLQGQDLNTPVLQNGSTQEITSEETKTGVIRAYKVELPGLKVVGKIELIESKAKEEGDMPERKPAAPGTKAVPVDNPEKRKAKPFRQENRPRKNPVVLQREREEREARERQEAKRRLEKELRTKRYQEKVSKYATPPKPISKLRNEDYEVYAEPKRQPAKTWMGKIAGWFITD